MWPALLILVILSALALHLVWLSRYRQLARSVSGKISPPGGSAPDGPISGPTFQTQQKLFDGMAEGILILDESGRIESMNLALRRLLGLTRDVAGQTVEEGLNRPDLKDVIRRALEKEEVIEAELESPGPPPRSLQLTASHYSENAGRQKGVIVVVHDVSRIRQLETSRKEFVANVSHELRTPLSLIKGCVETLQDGARGDPAQTQRFLQVIQKQTDRLIYLIEDLLSLSRLESGRDVLNLQTVEVAQVAQRVLEDLQSLASARAIRLHNLLPSGLRARADADRLEQVFFNLLENAIKYGREGGEIWVGGKPVPHQKLELWVRDNGPGIAPEARERVFERFYRADRARARETGGTGLGLAIVKHIVQAHGGEVWISSEVGQGATFFFVLPAEASQAP